MFLFLGSGNKSIWILMFFLFSLNFCYGQLINIESKRMQTDSTRFIFRGDLGFNHNNNDGQYLYQINSNLSTQFKSKNLRKIYFLIGDVSLIRSEEKDFENSWFLHFRYNQEITNLFRIEGFIQSQNNKILDVNARNLIGAGIRFKFISYKDFRVYLGSAYMLEQEQSDFLNEKFNNHRYSSYLSLSFNVPQSHLSISNTIYYQPLLKDFADFRVFEQFKMTAKISKNLSMFFLFDYYYDSNTPRERKQYSTQSSIGFGLSL